MITLEKLAQRISQIEERLPTEGLTPDLILGALIKHVETATVQSKPKD